MTDSDLYRFALFGFFAAPLLEVLGHGLLAWLSRDTAAKGQAILDLVRYPALPIALTAMWILLMRVVLLAAIAAAAYAFFT